MSSKVKVDFVSRVAASVSQGAVAAVVGAILGALMEPMVNRVLVERITIQQALKDFDIQKALKFFLTTLPTNMIKFPLYEAINTMLKKVKLPETNKGAIVGAIFTTLTLPLGNYRFCKSMSPPIPITFETLSKAYFPTLARDIVYGMSRNSVETFLNANFPDLRKSATGQFIKMFITALAACIISSPFNELRGYSLQPPSRRTSFSKFFKPVNYARSTAVGATNLALALATGRMVVDPMKVFLTKLREIVHPAVFVFGVIAVLVAIKSRTKKKEIENTESDKTTESEKTTEADKNTESEKNTESDKNTESQNDS